ncbi:transposase Tn554 [Fervidicella metallireducens AeB]|uniref:Transposase Tn554 n=1 Tax=Fervidicella metallireducens AeB TaxID=1403537 RepID=A0A017RRQ7_9CLOT|nr:tyrosine-type recombinase/integrase [Fervidicella metallireducens]EYE87337.1 transposase Tn554 [Fervidicella metallireducens AeB]
MYVQEVKLDEYKRSYILLDDNGMPVLSAVKYIKYLDNTGKSFNTIRAYCYALKLYHCFLEEKNLDLYKITISNLEDYVGWLKNPFGTDKVASIVPLEASRTAKTINNNITIVLGYYDYLYRIGMMDKNIKDKTTKYISGVRPNYKGFLYHITKGSPEARNILKVKEPKMRIKVLTKEQVELICNETTNIRDKFLIRLLFETGIRIGEALSLYIEDMKFDHNNGHKFTLKYRKDLANGARLKTGERDIFISQELMDLFDDYEYKILDELEIDTNFVFVKLKGENKGQPMEYKDVAALFNTLKMRTGIDIHAHLLRHTHATIFFQETKDIKGVQERLGHKQIQTTMNMYIHLSDEELRMKWEAAQHRFTIKKEREDN